MKRARYPMPKSNLSRLSAIWAVFIRIAGAVFVLLVLCAANADQIHDAAASGDMQTLRNLLKRKTTLVSSTDAKGDTPLHSAALGGRLAAAKFLISKRAKVNAKN